MTEFALSGNPVVSHYRILEKIGEGGMGVVYRAHDDRLGRDVALKFLPPGLLADESARDLLIHEARAASALNHPNICTVYDIGQAGGRDYIVMEYVKGVPLSGQIRENGLPGETVIRNGEQIADALAHAHEHGVVHRDLKTSNIMITPEGRAKVLDFGLAKRNIAEGVDGQTTHSFETEDTPGAGTMHYTAPEILRGERADARSDIWSLGVVLYEMTCGHRPFQGRTAYELSSHIIYHSPDPLPAKTAPGLQSVIERCLSKSPAERYQRAGEVLAALSVLRTNSPVPQRMTSPPPIAPAHGHSRSPWLFLAGAACLVLLAIAAWALIGRRAKREAVSGTVHSLAVLPLENMSGNPSEEFFAEGMTEELTTQLAQISALRVISRTSMMQYKDSKKSLPEIAKDLRVDAVVEGSVKRSGNRVQISAQLIQAATDKILWAKSYQGDAQDVLGLQRSVAQAIANEVKARLTPQEQKRLSNVRPVNPAAHEAYLKGLYLNSGSDADQRKAKAYFEDAIRIDPGYAPAYAGLSQYYWSDLDLHPRESMPLARENAVKALQLDPDLVQAHLEMAAIHFYADWDWAGAEKEFREALDLNSGDAATHRVYSVFLAALGRREESLAEIRKAQDLDPLSTSTQLTAGFVFYFARQYDRAIEQCRSVFELDPSSAGSYDCLGSSYLAKGMYEEAIAASQRATDLSGDDPTRMVGLARAYALADRKSDALNVLGRLRAQAKVRYVPPYFFAVIYAALNEKQEAFAWLDEAVREHDHYLAWLKADPAVDPLRSDARFQAVLKKVGLPN